MGLLDAQKDKDDSGSQMKFVPNDFPSATYQIPMRKAQKLFLPRGQTYFG